MKKIGIITIFDLDNYGNRLQNYAVEKIIKKWGGSPKTIVLPEYDATFKYSDKVGHILKRAYSLLKRNQKIERYLSFLDFQKKMNATVVKDLQKIDEKYDAFIVGSDQVWHPDVVNDNMFLKFAHKEKRFTISPSLGVDSIPESMREFYEDGINGFANVTIREESGKKVLENITKANINVTLDPVFLLDSKEWDSIAKKVNNLPEKYIVKYILGDYDEENERMIQSISEEYGLDVIDIYGEASDYYTLGPDQFVWMIKNAELVVTNSFHAVAFSILYKKEFWVFDRVQDNNDMNTRLQCLLEKFSLTNRHIRYKNNNMFDCDLEYEKLQIILEDERNKVYSSLKVLFPGEER